MKNLTFIFIAASLFIPVGTATQAQTEWTKHAGNPVLVEGSAGSWDENCLVEASVLFDGTNYKMWYGGQGGSDNAGNMSIGYATSPDGLEWTKYSGNPVLGLGADGSWDDYYVGYPWVVYDGTTYHMWYGGAELLHFRIGYATSPDGITWTKHASNPVLDTGALGSWETEHVITPVVLMLDDTSFFMWYGGTTLPLGKIGLATSSDGVVWEKWPDNPVMGIGAEWEDGKVFPEAVILIGDTLHMWYSGGMLKVVGLGGGQCGTGYATSSDGGVTWVKYTGNPVLESGGAGTWDSSCAGVADVLFDGTTYKMWYDSWDGSGGSIGYATAPDSIPVGIRDEGVIPDKFELSQNYPNPFNPETVIRYSIPKAENVSLVVYNLIGERIAHLIDEGKPAGSYTVSWDASNFASGIYFYRLHAGDFVQTRKMVLLK